MSEPEYTSERAKWEDIVSTKSISLIAEAATAIMTAFSVPPKRRGLILALIGLSRGQAQDVAASHLEVGKRLYPFDEEADEEAKTNRERAIQGQVKRELKKLEAWQAETRITLISFAEGAKVNDNYLPTTYTLHILPLISATLQEFGILRRKKARDAMRKAAEAVAGDRAAELRDIATRRKRDGLVVDPERYRRQAITLALKYATESADSWTAYEGLLDELARRREDVRKIRKTGDVQEEKELINNDLAEFKGGSRATETGGLEAPETDGMEPESGIAPLYNDPQEKGGNTVTVPGDVEDACTETDRMETHVEPGEADTNGFPALSDDEAHRALSLFESVGLTPTKAVFLRDGESQENKLARSEPPTKGAKLDAEAFRANLAEYLKEAEKAGQSFAVRWEGAFIQVDDADAATLYALRPFAFAGIETSLSNYQAWLAIAGEPDKATVEALRKRLLTALEQAHKGGNGGAYGSVRWPGSHNFKPERRAEFGGAPLVRLIFSRPGRKVSIDELAAFCQQIEGESPAEETKPSSPSLVAHSVATRPTGGDWWPDYGRCLAEAPLVQSGARKGLPDRSRADASFVCTSAKAGRSRDEVKSKLATVSEKAATEGAHYIERTVDGQFAFLGL